MKQPPQISDADIDRFIGMLQGKLNPALTPERRAKLFMTSFLRTLK